MVNSKFKNLDLVISFIGDEQGVAIVEEYDRKFLCSMFLKCHHHFHPLGGSKSDFVDVKIDEDCSLDKFEMIANK
jgi:hypothetical protein